MYVRKDTSNPFKQANPLRIFSRLLAEFCSNGFPRMFKYESDGILTGENAWADV